MAGSRGFCWERRGPCLVRGGQGALEERRQGGWAQAGCLVECAQRSGRGGGAGGAQLPQQLGQAGQPHGKVGWVKEQIACRVCAHTHTHVGYLRE